MMFIFPKVFRPKKVRGLRGDPRTYVRLKQHTRALVYSRIRELNAVYNVAYGRIAIRNTRSRWGSCSSKGNLNFHYRLVEIPLALADYVIAHELCHLKEFNHSPRFWALVSKTIPDWKERKRAIQSLSQQIQEERLLGRFHGFPTRLRKN